MTTFEKVANARYEYEVCMDAYREETKPGGDPLLAIAHATAAQAAATVLDTVTTVTSDLLKAQAAGQ